VGSPLPLSGWLLAYLAVQPPLGSISFESILCWCSAPPIGRQTGAKVERGVCHLVWTCSAEFSSGTLPNVAAPTCQGQPEAEDNRDGTDAGHNAE